VIMEAHCICNAKDTDRNRDGPKLKLYI
jgi:hypothetical protein